MAVLKTTSLPALFRARALERGDAPLFRKRDRHHLSTFSWNEAGERIDRIAAGLVRAGFKRGDRAAIMADNGPQTAFCDLAIQAAGGVVVTIYATSSPGEVLHILSDSGSEFLFLGKSNVLSKLGDALSSVQVVLMNDELKGGEDSVYLSEWMDRIPTEEERSELDARIEGLSEDDLSSLIYTSGTTGPTKGVMLTHGNILSNVDAALHILPLGEADTFLSFLPVSHSFERSMGQYAVIGAGAFIHYARSLGTVPQDFLEARPTVAMVVPRFLEKMRQKVLAALEEKHPPMKQLAKAAVKLRLTMVKKKRCEEAVPLVHRLLSPLALKLLGKIRDRLGGRLRFLVSGGAAMSVDVWDFFEAMGVTVLQGYGLTETSPVVSVNRPDRNKPASVGLPIADVQVRTAADGEIEVAGPNIMKGYWGKPDQTAEAISADGWFKSGDVGHIDGEGFLFITDRKKDIIVSSSGKNIAPQNIENALCQEPLIEFACVLGEGKGYMGALLSPNIEVLEARVVKLGIGRKDPASLAEDAEVINLYQQVVDRVNTSLAPYEKIARFNLVKQPFSMEGGELTPTLKVKRRVIEELHADEINRIFDPRR